MSDCTITLMYVILFFSSVFIFFFASFLSFVSSLPSFVVVCFFFPLWVLKVTCRDGKFRVATRLRAGGSGARIPVGANFSVQFRPATIPTHHGYQLFLGDKAVLIFLFSETSRPALGPQPAYYSVGTRRRDSCEVILF